MQSRRIVAQSLSRIPTVKRGEYLILKRLGHASAVGEPMASNQFDDLFGGKPKDNEALRVLFLDKVQIRERRRHRPAP